MIFDRIAILDWSAARGPKKGKDSIWLSEASQDGCTARNIATRRAAEDALSDLITDCLQRKHRLLLGADFAFGAPKGLITHLTGQKNALSWWAWLADRVSDSTDHRSNYRQIAAEMNRLFPGAGPFWGNGEASQIPDLPRLKPALPPGLAEHRVTDLAARGQGSAPKPVWQLAGAGAVGAQVLTGLPVLERLRHRFVGQVSVWPFELPTTAVVMAEVYPSLLSTAVKAHCHATGMVTDEAQVRLLAKALHRIGPTALARFFANGSICPEEGWILGTGQADLLLQALD
ncbi:MAG: molybdopterin guanine dinucleotide synthesis [Paracoccaceae bacterium]